MATATIISYPNNEINKSINVADTLNSFDIVKYLWIQVSEAPTDEYIEVVYNSKTITLYIADECRYSPIDIAFNNKEGALQILTFFKSRTDTTKIKNETFESDRGQPSNWKHQFVTFNSQGKSSFKVNSGFVDEDLNETFKQLLLSESVWEYNGTDFIPLNIASKSIEYKTRQKDRLINYEIEFDYSYNEINNI